MEENENKEQQNISSEEDSWQQDSNWQGNQNWQQDNNWQENQNWQQDNNWQGNQGWQGGYWQRRPVSSKGSGFVMASMVCALVAVFTFATVILPIICGSLAVIFGILSKTKEGRMEPAAKWGTVIGGVAMAGMLLLSTITVGRFFFDPTYRQQVEAMFEQTMGISFEEYQKMLENDYGEDANSYESLYDMIKDESGTPD